MTSQHSYTHTRSVLLCENSFTRKLEGEWHRWVNTEGCRRWCYARIAFESPSSQLLIDQSWNNVALAPTTTKRFSASAFQFSQFFSTLSPVIINAHTQWPDWLWPLLFSFFLFSSRWERERNARRIISRRGSGYVSLMPLVRSFTHISRFTINFLRKKTYLLLLYISIYKTISSHNERKILREDSAIPNLDHKHASRKLQFFLLSLSLAHSSIESVWYMFWDNTRKAISVRKKFDVSSFIIGRLRSSWNECEKLFQLVHTAGVMCCVVLWHEFGADYVDF